MAQLPPWPRHPIIYEINTWVWLEELSRRQGRPITLAGVPAARWDELAGAGFDAVWLMGVWERSPAGIRIARGNANLLAEFRRALPDFTPEDNVGSPYCVRRYRVAERLGGPAGLAAARRNLAERGIRLILDFVPNHVAPDHPWIGEHPEYLIQGTAEDLRQAPGAFIKIDGRIFACGRDPYFPPWPDVVQLNAFHPGARQALAATLAAIAGQCDAIRCDMAMLPMNSVFEQTWQGRAGPAPATDYWPALLAPIKAQYPDCRLIAEAYWDLERVLLRQGFDYGYDKPLYDRLVQGPAANLKPYLLADPADQQKRVRFIENHDEPRAAAVFSPEQARACALAFATLPGAKLFHQGQMEGRRARLPVFLARRPPEPDDQALAAFYRRLLAALRTPALRGGEWRLCEPAGWPDNQSHLSLAAWCWRKDREHCLIVINLSAAAAQGRVRLPWPRLSGGRRRLSDGFTGTVYDRMGSELLDPGLYVALGPWQFHVLGFSG